MRSKSQMSFGRPKQNIYIFYRPQKTLKWFGHVSRSSGLAKAILLGEQCKEGEEGADK